MNTSCLAYVIVILIVSAIFSFCQPGALSEVLSLMRAETGKGHPLELGKQTARFSLSQVRCRPFFP